MQGPKILTVDIETLPITTYNWTLFDEPRALDRLVKDWAIASFAAKWHGKSKMLYMDTRRGLHSASAYDDEHLVSSLTDLLDEADIVVGQNVRKFDMRKIRARAIQHDLPAFREPVIIDTKEMAKSVGMFTSNRLEYLSSMTDTKKGKHQKYPGFALWLGMLNDEQAAWEECRKYNCTDVKATEELWLKLRPWVRRHPDLGSWYRDDKKRCPRCGSEHLELYGEEHVGTRFLPAYLCTNCNGYCRERGTKTRGLVCL